MANIYNTIQIQRKVTASGQMMRASSGRSEPRACISGALSPLPSTQIPEPRRESKALGSRKALKPGYASGPEKLRLLRLRV